MTAALRIAIHGAAGRMGQALLTACASHDDVEVVAALVGPAAASDPARDLLGEASFSTALPEGCTPDVLVDFSSAAGFDAALDQAVQRGVAFVSGTTGLDASQRQALAGAAAQIPVLWAANFSLGIAVLRRLVADAALALPDWDCEILEAHHRFKRDAPSGTALVLGSDIARARGLDAHQAEPSGDRQGERISGDIGYSVIRGGDIVGDHQVLLLADGERLELAHRATDRMVFARGALHAARWLAGKPAGSYTLDDSLPAATRQSLPQRS